MSTRNMEPSVFKLLKSLTILMASEVNKHGYSEKEVFTALMVYMKTYAAKMPKDEMTHIFSEYGDLWKDRLWVRLTAGQCWIEC